MNDSGRNLDPSSSKMPVLNKDAAVPVSGADVLTGKSRDILNVDDETVTSGGRYDECKLGARARGHSNRSSSDGAVRAMEGANNDNVLYRTVSESDKQARERKNLELIQAGALDSETDTEGPDSPVRMSPSLKIDALSTSEGIENSAANYGACSCGQSTKQRAVSIAEVKEIAFARLQEELQKAQQELKLKDEEVEKLRGIRDEVSAELEDLTASLFEEAHNMVREANVKQATAHKYLKEANLKIEVLQAEVQALKTLVITSTPAMPNRKLHPQIDSKSSRNRRGLINGNMLNGHHRSPSNYELQFKSDSPPGSPAKEETVLYTTQASSENEVDPICHKEFVSWKESPEFDKSLPLIARMYREDILPCLNFPNVELSEKLLKSIEKYTLVVEAVGGKNPFPKKCSLLDTPRLCKYKMKFGDSDKWFYISQLCRNRITSVCDLLCYLRYIKQGLVRSPVNDVYFEVMRKRRDIMIARLGLSSDK